MVQNMAVASKSLQNHKGSAWSFACRVHDETLETCNDGTTGLDIGSVNSLVRCQAASHKHMMVHAGGGGV